MANPNEPVESRFWGRVEKGADCWLWTGAKDGAGYGRLSLDGRRVGAHRVSWMIHTGSMPPRGLTIDHLCFNRLCVNPAHLEVVTSLENVRRAQEFYGIHQYATECVNGHQFTPENTRIRPNGRRRCRQCERDEARRRYHRRTAA